MISTVIADDGTQLPLESIEQVLAYNGNFLSTITINYEVAGTVNTYVQTFTNNGTKITTISPWELQ